MKLLFALSIFLLVSKTYCQNEFAATAFYSEFLKILADAQNGFTLCKGEKIKNESEVLTSAYKSKCLLPLADSGIIVVPVSGNPFVLFYFEPDKIRLKVDQRGANLRDAIVTAYGPPLYSRTETTLINNFPLSDSFYFTDPNETRQDFAIFRMTIFYKDSKYYLSLEIRGKK